jgi:hypothetical protein
VDYTVFNDDIESIFTTKDLEKAPLLEPELFQPSPAAAINVLKPEMEAIVTKCMERLAEQVGGHLE